MIDPAVALDIAYEREDVDAIKGSLLFCIKKPEVDRDTAQGLCFLFLQAMDIETLKRLEGFRTLTDIEEGGKKLGKDLKTWKKAWESMFRKA